MESWILLWIQKIYCWWCKLLSPILPTSTVGPGNYLLTPCYGNQEMFLKKLNSFGKIAQTNLCGPPIYSYGISLVGDHHLTKEILVGVIFSYQSSSGVWILKSKSSLNYDEYLRLAMWLLPNTKYIKILRGKAPFLWVIVLKYLEKMIAFCMCVVSNGLILIVDIAWTMVSLLKLTAKNRGARDQKNSPLQTLIFVWLELKFEYSKHTFLFG